MYNRYSYDMITGGKIKAIKNYIYYILVCTRGGLIPLLTDIRYFEICYQYKTDNLCILRNNIFAINHEPIIKYNFKKKIPNNTNFTYKRSLLMNNDIRILNYVFIYFGHFELITQRKS